MTMRKYITTSVALLPLLFSLCYAAQDSSSRAQSYVFSSDDGGTASYLGVDIADITPERLSALKLKEERGVEVTMVDQDAPAGKAGIKEHDVILSMNGMNIESGAQLRRMIHETPPGRVVTLGLSRDGQPMTVKVQLADKHKEFAFTNVRPDIHVQIPEIHIPDIDVPSFNMIMTTSSERSGLTVENITPQLGEFFGVKNGNGVLVRSVEKGSRGEKAGFRAGDVIVKVNDESVHDTSDFSHAMKSRNGNSVSVNVIRDRREQNLSLPLPDRKDNSWFEQESFDADPSVDADSYTKLSELQDEIAKLQPQMTLANAQKEMEKAQKSACKVQKEFQQKAREQMEKSQEKFKGEQEKLKHELDRMVEQMRSDWL
jgi:serine protease Do